MVEDDGLPRKVWLSHQGVRISHMHGGDEVTAPSVTMGVAQDNVGVRMTGRPLVAALYSMRS